MRKFSLLVVCFAVFTAGCSETDVEKAENAKKVALLNLETQKLIDEKKHRETYGSRPSELTHTEVNQAIDQKIAENNKKLEEALPNAVQATVRKELETSLMQIKKDQDAFEKRVKKSLKEMRDGLLVLKKEKEGVPPVRTQVPTAVNLTDLQITLGQLVAQLQREIDMLWVELHHLRRANQYRRPFDRPFLDREADLLRAIGERVRRKKELISIIGAIPSNSSH